MGSQSGPMKKRTFLKLSSLAIAGTAIGCNSESPRHNWAGNINYSSSKVFEPASIDELRKIILDNNKIKAQGTCHSFNTIADSSHGFISSSKLNQVVSLDEEKLTVTVESGIRYGELCKYLES